VLDYLGRYVFRVAITNTRIVGLDDRTVTIRHKHRTSNRWRTTRLPGHEFMRRFLQHVLPKGLHKVRYFGLWHHTRREQAARARLLLQLAGPTTARHAEAIEVAADPPADRAQPQICPLQTRPADLHSAPFPQAGVRAMTPRAVSSEPHRRPRRTHADEGRIFTRCRRRPRDWRRQLRVWADVPTAIPAPTRDILLTAAGRPVASPRLETDSRRPKLPSRTPNLKSP
jgi:hypothetical protein